jgi:isoquinoline 1-oxidoreductase alpha subunit
MAISLTINGSKREVQAEPDTPLLWVLRDELGMTGTKFGCGIAQCGACTVHINGSATRSCVMPVQALAGQSVTTIEHLAHLPVGRALQQAWIEHQVPQCGYCQGGFLMAITDLLTRIAQPSDAEIDAAITNLCRCGTYPRMRAAIRSASARLAGKGAK